MKPLRDAQREVLAAVSPLPAIRAPLSRCLGLVLAAPVTASHPVPPFANSAVDGYAVSVEDIAKPGVVLDVIEHVAAGAVPVATLRPGAAIKVMTGAPLPNGTAAVVKVEDTENPEPDTVRIVTPADAGSAIRPIGGDIAAGDTVLTAGERLGPAHLGVLASLGEVTPLVHRRPLVAVMSTGDEIVPPDTGDLAPGQIRDANRPLLVGLLTELGVDLLDLGIVADDAADLRRAIADAVAADVVVTSGGVSMGDHDVVKEELAALGTVEFWKVAMQPAKPFGFGALARDGGDMVPFFGLPGNPVSVFVAFEQYLRPALLKMMGATARFRPRVPGILIDGARTDPEKDVFVRVVATMDPDGSWWAQSAGGQSSNVLSAMAAANAFAVVGRGTDVVEPGGAVTLELFRQPATRPEETPDG